MQGFGKKQLAGFVVNPYFLPISGSAPPRRGGVSAKGATPISPQCNVKQLYKYSIQKSNYASIFSISILFHPFPVEYFQPSSVKR